jgi:hypothetical protein
MKQTPPAECLAIIICESVVEDHRSHNKCILNTYNRIASPRFPARQDRLTVFISLTSGRGKQPFVVEFLAPDGNPMAKGNGEVEFPDPRAVVDVVLDLRGFPIPQPGSYGVRVTVNGAIVGQRRFAAVKSEEGSGA